MYVTVVTITNRKRWHLLQRTLAAAFAAGADRAVVVDNEAEELVAEKVLTAFPDRARTIRLDQNRGPAGAYCEGIRGAIEDGAEFLLLLDDDNVPKPNALALLKSTYISRGGLDAADRLCIAGFRPVQESLRGHVETPLFPAADEFIGFRIEHIAHGLWKRRPWAKTPVRPTVPRVLEAPVRRSIAPWGGLFFHRALIERFGYPDPRFVLYYDDVEFTNRVTSGGGEIWLDPAAEIDDIEESWQSNRKENYVQAWLTRGSDEQVYYSVRNRVYLETHMRKGSWKRELNGMLLKAILLIFAVRANNLYRFRLILKAAGDGRSGVLGKIERSELIR